jgi:hypothetical protein
MLVNFELLAQMGIADPALLQAWRGAYQSHAMQPFEADIPAVVAALLGTRWPSFGGVSLKEVISFGAADAARAQVLAGVIKLGSALPAGEPFRRLYAAATLAYYDDPATYAARNANSAVVNRILQSIPPGVRSAEKTPAAAREAEIKAIYGQTGGDLMDLFAD